VKQDMTKIATERRNCDEEFVPFSAVMRWSKTFESEDFLSFVIEFSVWDGKNSQSVERKTQVWERKFGTKCKSSYFFEPKKLKEEFANLYGEKTRFDKELFALCEDGFEFYEKGKDGYKTFRIPHGVSEVEFVTNIGRSV
jgi:hypothetical protein